MRRDLRPGSDPNVLTYFVPTLLRTRLPLFVLSHILLHPKKIFLLLKYIFYVFCVMLMVYLLSRTSPRSNLGPK